MTQKQYEECIRACLECMEACNVCYDACLLDWVKKILKWCPCVFDLTENVRIFVVWQPNLCSLTVLLLIKSVNFVRKFVKPVEVNVKSTRMIIAKNVQKYVSNVRKHAVKWHLNLIKLIWKNAWFFTRRVFSN